MNRERSSQPSPRGIRQDTQDPAETWFAENDPEGVAFEYEVLE